MHSQSLFLGTYHQKDIIDTVSEKDKLKVPYLKGNIDKNIGDLVHNKEDEHTAYEYFLGRRDNEELQYLTDNYGVGHPGEIPSMRLVGRRISSLIGQFLQHDLDYEVTCSNTSAIEAKMLEKKHKILKEMELEYKLRMSDIQNSAAAKGDVKYHSEVLSRTILDKLKTKYNTTFKADFEVAAKDYSQYYRNKYDLKDKFRVAAKDFMITGQLYNRVFVVEEGRDPEHWICSPLHFYFEPVENSNWVQDSRRCIYRMRISPQDILYKFGHLISTEDQETVAEAITGYYTERYGHEAIFYHNKNNELVTSQRVPRYQDDLVDVYHTEWVATNDYKSEDRSSLETLESDGSLMNKTNKRKRQDLYSGFKADLGGGLYFGMGKYKHAPRSVQDPDKTHLTYNGIVLHSERTSNHVPFSMIMATKDLSDLYDITHFHLNNLLAAARPGGTITVLEQLPADFGDSPEERILTNTGYEKAYSQKVVSISQEGMEDTYGAGNQNMYYPANLSGDLVNAFEQYLQSLENQADRMLGLNNRMLGEMEERDGKAVTMQAIKQGEIITKELFYLLSNFIKKTYENIINTARYAYKDRPLLASHSLGDNYKIFTLEKQFSMSDFNVHYTEEANDIELNQRVDSLIQSIAGSAEGMSDLKSMFELLVAKSVSQKKQIITGMDNSSFNKMREEYKQALEQLESLTKQNEELTGKIEQLSKLDKALKEKELQLKERKIKGEEQIEKEKLDVKKKEVEDKRQSEIEKIRVERIQLQDNIKSNDAVYWDK